MNLCERLDIDFPLFAFSHCRDVVAEVTRTGGMGVLGAIRLTPEELDAELTWIDEQVDGRPYGVDLIVPMNMDGQDDEPSTDEVLGKLPDEHKLFTNDLLSSHGIDPSSIDDDVRAKSLWLSNNARQAGAKRAIEVAFSHPISLIANALGVPPKRMLELGKYHNVPVAALVGSKKQAIRQAGAGVDVVIASGAEAGGHCGDVPSMVLIPEVCEALTSFPDTSVLAAGGIVTGRQMAAAMAMGAEGVWCGSVWLTTSEAETSSVIREKMLAAGSRDTVRSCSRTGKFSRQLRSAWTDAWEETSAPRPLPMPLQTALVMPLLNYIEKLATTGHKGACALATYYVGQGVGLMNHTLSVRTTMQAFREDFLHAYERLHDEIDGM